MRNLSLSGTNRIQLISDGHARAVVFDGDETSVIIASEVDEGVPEIHLFKWIDSEHKASELAVYRPTLPVPSWPAVLSIKVLAESHTLILILYNGEIATLSLDEATGPENQFETVGEVEVGLKAASWSPDESRLVLVTGEDNVILMTSSFETISERPMRTSEEGEEKSVNVGWGSKTTQFHGSLGKAAAKEGSVPELEIGSSTDDDGLPRISWKGDGSTFVISSLEEVHVPSSTESSKSSSSTTKKTIIGKRRVLRYYSQTLAYLHPAESIAGLEHTLSWRPAGNLIASTQRFSATIPGLGKGREGRHDIVFFEPNGLRHGGFPLRPDRWRPKSNSEEKSSDSTSQNERPLHWGYRVRELLWNVDSTVLAVWVEVGENSGSQPGHIVQLWTSSNYHWFLKQEIRSEWVQCQQFTNVTWHPEDAMKLFITTSSNEVLQYSYIWDTYVSRVLPPHDAAYVAVVDGSNINLTPFRLQNVPPPMCTHSHPLSPSRGPPVHVAFSSNDDSVAALWEDGYVQLIQLGTVFERGKEKPLKPQLLWEGFGSGDKKPTGSFRQVLLKNGDANAWALCTLSSSDSLKRRQGRDEMRFVSVQSGNQTVLSSKLVELPAANGRNVVLNDVEGGTNGSMYWQSPQGDIIQVSPDEDMISPSTKFPVRCHRAEVHDDLFICLSPSGDIYISFPDTEPRHIASKCNSFIISLGILVYTTVTHQAFFVPLDELKSLRGLALDDNIPEWEQRRVERGSRIVTAVDSNMSLVLQMPRGNLETIYPRPLVIRHVKRNVDRRNYRDAFIDCRKHRIDLNILVDHDHSAFMANIPTFIQQVHEVDHINLFLAGIGRHANQPAEKIAHLCDVIRAELEKKDLKKYVNSVLTTHVVKTPPDYEGALSLLLQLQKEDISLVENAVKYIIFLADANLLFDTALGMYDFSLVLMIAQQSQKDPREYLPFLRNLRSLETNYQRFKIDEHLKRNKKALGHLYLAGESRFAEAKEFVEKYRLHLEALDVWKDDTQKQQELYDLYASYLFERREFEEAAIAFRKGGKLQKASMAHERALQWREVFEIAHMEQIPEEEIDDMASRIADQLASKRRYAEAAQVSMEYLEDIEASVRYLAEGALFSEAKRLVMKHGRQDLLQETINPAILNTRVSMSEELEEIREQFEKQLQRIRALRERKEAEPDAFYGIEENIHNVDVMTDVSAYTAFTRYTAAPSTLSRGTSKRSQKLKRRSERKAGKKGTIEEEEYLLNSLTKLVARFNAMLVDCRQLLPHLMTLDDHSHEVGELQAELAEFQSEFSRGIDEIWTPSLTENEDQRVVTGFPGLPRKIDPREKHPKPEAGSSEWKYSLLTSR